MGRRMSATIEAAEEESERWRVACSRSTEELDAEKQAEREEATRKLQAMPSATRWDCRAASRDPSLLLV